MRFDRYNADTEELRSALIEDDLDDLSLDDLEAIMELYWDDFKPLAIRFLDSRWSDGGEVWLEAGNRGYFDK
jgi:hypothetical protein